MRATDARFFMVNPASGLDFQALCAAFKLKIYGNDDTINSVSGKSVNLYTLRGVPIDSIEFVSAGLDIGDRWVVS
jgi:hypothetical protein